MHRLGFQKDYASNAIELIKKYPNIEIVGAATHFAEIEEPNQH